MKPPADLSLEDVDGSQLVAVGPSQARTLLSWGWPVYHGPMPARRALAVGFVDEAYAMEYEDIKSEVG